MSAGCSVYVHVCVAYFHCSKLSLGGFGTFTVSYPVALFPGHGTRLHTKLLTQTPRSYGFHFTEIQEKSTVMPLNNTDGQAEPTSEMPAIQPSRRQRFGHIKN